MFKKIYDSLSMPVHVELMVHADYICLKNWSEVTGDMASSINTQVADVSNPKSLTFNKDIEHGSFPPEASGIYHNRLPACLGMSKPVSGQVLYDAMPSVIKSSHEDIKTKHFVCNSYSWIDPTDPSISSGELGDMACWTIGIARSWGLMTTLPAYNSIAQSYISKAHPLRTARQYGGPAALFVYQPFATDKFDKCSLTLKYNKAFGFSTNILDGWTVGANEKEMFKSYNYVGQLYEAFPHFNITSGGDSITADGHDTVNFKMVDKDDNLIEKNSEAYLESTGGYLPKTRIPITNGLGSFKVTALGLEASDTFKIKIGFRNLTGIEEVNYTVT